MTYKHSPARMPMRKAVTASVQQAQPTSIMYLNSLLREIGSAAERVSTSKQGTDTKRNPNPDEVH